jgi:ribosome-associated protein
VVIPKTDALQSTPDAVTHNPPADKVAAAKMSDEQKAARSLQLAVAAAQTAKDNRGQEILVLDLRELTCIFDYFVIASGSSRRQLHAMSEEIDHKLEDDLGDQRMGIEGYQGSSWILLDYGTVVVHLFDADTRDYYAIEKLWGEAKPVDWEALVQPQ